MTSIRMALSLIALITCSIFYGDPSSQHQGDFVAMSTKSTVQTLPPIHPINEVQELARIDEPEFIVERTPASRKLTIRKGG